MARDLERDIIPMARQWGMAIAPWNVLAGGKLRSDAEEQRRRDTGEKGRTLFTATGWERTEAEAKMSRALEKVAGEVGAKSITSGTLHFVSFTSTFAYRRYTVAIAYVMQKPGVPRVFPIIGGRKVEHMKANIEALQIALSPEQIKYLESINEFDIGFPNNFIVRFYSFIYIRLTAYLELQGTGEENNIFQNWVGNIDRVDYPQPILPKEN
jgi:aryl-alcohol dehydrogenase-like predicted oxidoreductase